MPENIPEITDMVTDLKRKYGADKPTGNLHPSMVRHERMKIREQTEEKKKEFTEFLRNQNAKITALELQCPHSNQVWEPDPSGNNDSAYCCPDCGKQSKRKL